MSCCDNPIDLGCLSSCDPIVTNATATCAGGYSIVYYFNGAAVSIPFYQSAPGYITIPAGYLNESYNGQFRLYDASGELIGCYTFTMSASSTVSAMPTDSEILTTTMEVVSTACIQGLPDDAAYIYCIIVPDDMLHIGVGTTFTLSLSVDGGTGSGAIAVEAGDGVSVSGTTLTITDMALVEANGGVKFYISPVIESCVDSLGMTYDVTIGCVGDLPEGVISGEQGSIHLILTAYDV